VCKRNTLFNVTPRVHLHILLFYFHMCWPIRVCLSLLIMFDSDDSR
jgi:hypothetical protein